MGRRVLVARRVFLLLVGAFGLALIVWLIGGRYTLEKTLTALAIPCGLIWLGLGVALCTSWQAKKPALVVAAWCDLRGVHFRR